MIDRLVWLACDTPGKFPGEGGRWSRRHADDISLPGADHGGKIRRAHPNPQEARKFVPTSNVGGQVKLPNETHQPIHGVAASATTEVITKAMCETL